MDYKEMKKEELVQKLEEQKHLAQAVEAKDVEIANLIKAQAELKEKTIPSIKKLEEENKRLIAFANQYINVFKNTLKALQGTLDNAIELQDILVNGVKEK